MKANNKIGIEAGRVRLYYSNHDYYCSDTFATIDEAIVRARKSGFDARFEMDGRILGAWSIIGGFRPL